MEENTNFNVNPALMTAILVFLALVLLTTSSVAAQPITVDGDGSDWDPSWFLFSDSINDTPPTAGSYHYYENGYDLTDVWQHYNATENTLYFRYDTSGIVGDSDNDGDPNTCVYLDHDRTGLGLGEVYVVRINASPTGNPDLFPDLIIKYGNGNQIAILGWVQAYTTVTAAFCNGTPFSHVVEFSVDNVTGWMDNPYKYSMAGWASSATDGIAEDWLDETIYVSFPPVANFTFVAGDCNQTVRFDPSGSYDDPYGGIVSYTWDFDHTGTGSSETRYNDNSFTHVFPVSRGAYNVSLTVTDTDGLTNTLVREVMVNRVPALDDVTASNMNVVDPGELVLFQGWYSDPDGDTLTHRWFIDGVEIASGSSTTYSSVSYFVDRSITATLTIEDPYNCVNTSSVTVAYLRPPVPVIKFTGTGCLEIELDASDSYGLDGSITDYDWDLDDDGDYDDASGITYTFSPVPAGAPWIGLKVTDDTGLSNTTRKQILVTGYPHAVAKVNGHTSIQLQEGGMDVTFDGTGSSADSPATLDLSKCQWTIPGETCPPGLGPYTFFIDHAIAANLKVEDNYGCIQYATVTIREPPTEDVPILTPAGMIALISVLCIAGAGRITRKGRRS